MLNFIWGKNLENFTYYLTFLFKKKNKTISKKAVLKINKEKKNAKNIISFIDIKNYNK